MARPRKKPPDESGGVKEFNDVVEPAENNSEAHQSTDIRHLWTVPPIYDDGLTVRVGKSLVISQSPLMGDTVEIILSLNEAEALLELLPEAVAALRKVTA